MFILASTSPRRLELLRQIGVVPDKTLEPICDETPLKGELPRAVATRLATQKALSLKDAHKGAVILAGDTVVACGRRMLPKCADEAEVLRCLKLLSGRRHRVYTAVCVVNAAGQAKTKLSVNIVQFKRLSDVEFRNAHLLSEGVGKAGGYALQGQASSLIAFISGSPSGIIGLPLFETAQLLKNANVIL